jgi:hypothetical protein
MHIPQFVGGAEMSGKKIFELLKHLNLISISIPVGVLVASAFLSLQPIIRQALIGIMLIWFGFEAMTGFEFWQ